MVTLETRSTFKWRMKEADVVKRYRYWVIAESATRAIPSRLLRVGSNIAGILVPSAVCCLELISERAQPCI